MGRQRYVIVSILAIATITGMAIGRGFEWIFDLYSFDDPFIAGMRELPASHGIGYALAAIAAVGIIKHAPSYTMANEVAEELSKVTWPTREETGSATVVVVVTVLICSAYLGAFDAVWLALTDMILGLRGSIKAG